MNRRRFLRSSLAAAVAASLPVDDGFAAVLGRTAPVTADIDALTGEGEEVTLARAAVQELADSLRGNLLLPGHAAYEDWPIDSDAAEHVAWLKETWSTFEPFIEGFYTNDLIDETQEQVDRNYLGNYGRLVQLKNQYDPGNLFRLNANIRPTV